MVNLHVCWGADVDGPGRGVVQICGMELCMRNTGTLSYGSDDDKEDWILRVGDGLGWLCGMGSRVDDGVGGAEYRCEAASFPDRKQAEWRAEAKKKKKDGKGGGWEVRVCLPEPAEGTHFRGEHAVPSIL